MCFLWFQKKKKINGIFFLFFLLFFCVQSGGATEQRAEIFTIFLSLCCCCLIFMPLIYSFFFSISISCFSFQMKIVFPPDGSPFYVFIIIICDLAVKPPIALDSNFSCSKFSSAHKISSLPLHFLLYKVKTMEKSITTEKLGKFIECLWKNSC